MRKLYAIPTVATLYLLIVAFLFIFFGSRILDPLMTYDSSVGSLVFFGIYFLATFLLQTFVNFIESNLLKALIFLAIPAIFVVIRIYRRRLENAELRRAYLNQITDQEVTWKQQLKYVLRSADFRAEIAAFATVLLLILSIAFLLGGAKGYFWTNMMSLFLSFVLYEGIYVIIDMICWLAVHRIWFKEKL